MPVTTHQTKRYRGKERIMLKRLIKVIGEIQRHNIKYPQPPSPAPINRRHLEFTVGEEAEMAVLEVKSQILLAALYPPAS